MPAWRRHCIFRYTHPAVSLLSRLFYLLALACLPRLLHAVRARALRTACLRMGSATFTCRVFFTALPLGQALVPHCTAMVLAPLQHRLLMLFRPDTPTTPPTSLGWNNNFQWFFFVWDMDNCWT